MRQFFWVVAGCFLLLAGCTSESRYSEILRSWHGATTKSLFSSWGYPNRIARMREGRRLLIYRKDSKAASTRGDSHDICTTWFKIDKNKRIIATRYKGKGCHVSQSL